MDEKLEQAKKRFNKKIKIGGIVFILACLGFGGFIWMNGGSVHHILSTTSQSLKEGKIPFMDEDQSKKKDKDSAEGGSANGSTADLVTDPNTLEVAGRKFFLFDEDILLPMDSKIWQQYNVPGSESGLYNGIAEFYVQGESPQEWTQKFTIHQIKDPDTDCFIFTDKLVNGIIATEADNASAQGQDFDPKSLSFNYVVKESGNTLMYWGKKGVQDMPDETQFTRVFKVPYSEKVYLVTYTLKESIDELSIDAKTKYMKTLNAIQELKKAS